MIMLNKHSLNSNNAAIKGTFKDNSSTATQTQDFGLINWDFRKNLFLFNYLCLF